MNTEQFKKELYSNLTENILPYWIDRMVDPRGGFYGRRDGDDILDPEAPKGAILNARILWSFAAAYRTTGRQEYLDMALRARDYIIGHFYDKEFGGVYWSLNADGTPLDTKKQFYAIGFTIYGLSELARATGDKTALEYAIRLFHDIDLHSRDEERGGYYEAMTRDWMPIADMRLSDKDDNASKTMNTHLHIIEPYTNLLRVWPDDTLRSRTVELQRIFLDKILDRSTWHLGLFFDDDWRRLDSNVSYGHDIEASWLLLETAQVLGDEQLLAETMDATKKIAEASFEGRRDDGSMVYELYGDGHLNDSLDWWVQAEDVIGQLYLWKYHGQEEMLEKAWQSWRYINGNIVDKENGEWHWGRNANGTINRHDDKAGFWKCPYHNSRMCLESLSLLS